MRNRNTNIKKTTFPSTFPRHSFTPSFPIPLTDLLCVAGNVGYCQYIAVSLCSSVGPLHGLQSFMRKPVPVWALHGVWFLEEYPCALAWSSPWAAGEYLLWCPKNLLLWPWCFLCCFSLLPPPPLPVQCFLLFPTYAFTEEPQTPLMGSAVSCDVSTGELTEAGCVQHQTANNLFSQRSPLQLSC